MFYSLTLVFLTFLSVSSAGRILFIPGHNLASHTKSVYLAAEVLERAGHNVSVLQLITDSAQETANKAGVTDLIIRTVRMKPVFSAHNSMAIIARAFWESGSSQARTMMEGWKFTTQICADILSHDKTRKALEAIWNEPWDAVFLDELTTCGMAAVINEFADRRTVIVDFTLVPPSSLTSKGSVVPITTKYLGAFEQRNFLYRLGTTLHGLQYGAMMKYMDFQMPYYNQQLAGVRTTLLGEKRTIDVTSVPTGLDVPHPQSLDVGQFDTECTSDSSLPERWKNFVEDVSSEGTILFAMGHYAGWTHSPPGVVDAFITAFSRLPRYRIIWQFKGDFQLENTTSNILMEPWIPQKAILNHPKTKLFISHMGIKSMREAVCAKVPVIALPMAADQFRNAIIADRRGIGLYMDKTKLSVDYIYQSIRKVLDEPRYATAVSRLQDQLSDKIRNASSIFTFQLEYFIRWNEKRVLNSYVKLRETRLSLLSRWYVIDAVGVLSFLGLFIRMIF